MEKALNLLDQLPAVWIYISLGLGAALENLIPVIPADTFIVAGGFVAGLGRVDPVGVFIATWGMNVAGALLVYGLGLRYGLAFFRDGAGSRVLSIGQLHRLESFYKRWGVFAIFFARFLPGLRAVVPIFAGVTRQSPAVVVLPVTVASAIWYGGLVRLGTLAGDNVDSVVETLGSANRIFLGVSILACALIVGVWYKGRRSDRAEAQKENA
ncbi:MAG: DedA family protein [Longimicrobiales bacterium]